MILITVARTLFYQFFLLFIGISIGFICNAEWIGWKSNLITRSYTNIFHPIEFDEKICQNVKNWGATRIWAELGNPKDFEVIEDAVAAEEFYIGKFRYTDVKTGQSKVEILSYRVRWKPWEYYWENPQPLTEEELWDYIENGTLNSKETEKALRLRKEKLLQQRKDEKDEKKNGSADPRVYSGLIL